MAVALGSPTAANLAISSSGLVPMQKAEDVDTGRAPLLTVASIWGQGAHATQHGATNKIGVCCPRFTDEMVLFR